LHFWREKNTSENLLARFGYVIERCQALETLPAFVFMELAFGRERNVKLWHNGVFTLGVSHLFEKRLRGHP
jgi:hypothetical protein